MIAVSCLLSMTVLQFGTAIGFIRIGNWPMAFVASCYGLANFGYLATAIADIKKP